MEQSGLEALLLADEFDGRRIASLVASLRADPPPTQDDDHWNYLSRFIHRVLLDHPERVPSCKPLLDYLVEQGQSPFQSLSASRGANNIYQVLAAHDATHPLLPWCLSLPGAPPSPETDFSRRTLSDALDVYLGENALPGSAAQLAMLDLFGFKLLEPWADGRTTLDRIMEAYRQRYVEDNLVPYKEFELADVQRGFTRLLQRALKEDPATEHVHVLRWHAWHHAFKSHERQHQGGLYKPWGSESWQAALRNFEQTLSKALGLSKLPVNEQEDILWSKGVAYLNARALSTGWASVVGGAGYYQLLDSCERPRAPSAAQVGGFHGRLPDAQPSTTTHEAYRALDTSTALAAILSRATVQEVHDIFAKDKGLPFFSQGLAAILVAGVDRGDNRVCAHPALVPCLLPLLARGSMWLNGVSFNEKMLLLAPWPTGAPWEGLIAEHAWCEEVQSWLDARALLRCTPTAPKLSSARRM